MPQLKCAEYTKIEEDVRVSVDLLYARPIHFIYYVIASTKLATFEAEDEN